MNKEQMFSYQAYQHWRQNPGVASYALWQDACFVDLITFGFAYDGSEKFEEDDLVYCECDRNHLAVATKFKGDIYVLCDRCSSVTRIEECQNTEE